MMGNCECNCGGCIDTMEMPTPCSVSGCDNIFDLTDGFSSTESNNTICGECKDKELELSYRLTTVDGFLDNIGDVDSLVECLNLDLIEIKSLFNEDDKGFNKVLHQNTELLSDLGNKVSQLKNSVEHMVKDLKNQ